MNINSLSDFAKARKIAQDTINQAITEELQDLANDTQNRVPVRTGELQRIYEISVNGSNQFTGGVVNPVIFKDGYNEISNSYNTDYAEYAHENAVNPSSRGYFLIPYNNWVNGLEDRIQARLDKL